MPIYPYSFQLPPLNLQDIPSNGAVGEFLGISAGGVLDWLPVASGGGDMLKSENLSGLANYTTARTNIGLGTTDSPTFANLTLTSPSLASSAPVTISQTWNAVGQTFKALVVNAAGTSDANSASGSLLADFQVNGVSKVSVRKDGAIVLPFGYAGIIDGSGNSSGTNYTWNGPRLGPSAVIGWTAGSPAGATDTILLRDGAANTLALRNGAAAQTFRVYNTYTDASNYERAAFSWASNQLNIGVDYSGSGVARKVAILGAGIDFNHAGVGTRMSISTAGNVGIGTTAPSEKLHVVGNSLFGDNTVTGTPTPNNVSLGGAYGSNTPGSKSNLKLDILNGGSSRFGIGVSAGLLEFQSGTGSGFGFYPNNGTTSALHILTSGNVGIGTTAPSANLELYGNSGQTVLKITSVNPGTGSNLIFNGAFGQLNNNTGSFFITNESATDPVIFRAGGQVERMRITAAGNVGIGTTSPTSKLHVAETWNNAGTAFCAIKSVITDTNSAPGSDFLELYSGTSTQPLRVDINKTGQINIYGAWTDSSNYERLSISGGASGDSIISTNRAGTGVARGLDVQTDGVSRIYIPPSNAFISVIANIFVLSGTQIRFGNLTRLSSNSDGILRISSSSEADFVRLQLGGTADTSPAIARDGAGIKFTGASAGATAWIKVPPVAVTALPDATVAGAGARAFVNDASSPTFGSAVTGGGAVLVPVYSTGSAWHVG